MTEVKIKREVLDFATAEKQRTLDFALASERDGPVWGKRLLPRFKTVNGVRLQLHATKGWRKA